MLQSSLSELDRANLTLPHLALLPSQLLLGTRSEDGFVTLWELETYKPMWKRQVHDNIVNAIGFSWDSKSIASGSDDKTVGLWDTLEGREQQKFEGYVEWVNAVAFSPDN